MGMMGRRVVAVVAVMALVAGGPLARLATAQQPGPMEPPSPLTEPSPAEPQPPAPEPRAAIEEREPRGKHRRGLDLYDVGAAVMTVAGAPLKGVVCVVGGVLGAALFVATLGTADRAAAAVVRESCAHRWIVRGADIRPEVAIEHARDGVPGY
jgi:hypothetical protein